MKELTNDNLKEILEQNKKVIVQFGASWCGSCRILKPKFKELGDATSDVEFVYVDAENSPLSRELATIDNLPTFAGYSNGKLVKQGATSKIEFVKEILDEVTSN